MEQNSFKQKFALANEKILAAENILLITHERPDGDGLSSLCALASYIDSLGKNQTLFCADQPPEFFSFLPYFNKIISGKIPTLAETDRRQNPLREILPEPIKNITTTKPLLEKEGGRTEGNIFSSFDLIIVLDCGAQARTGLATEIRARDKNQFLIEFDHHPKNDDYADLEIRAIKSSTAELLYHFFSDNDLMITKDIANCLLTGILTDTGNLLFGAVTEETISISSSLLLRGATFPKIMRRTLQNKSLAAMKAWGRILDNLKLNEKYNLAYSVLTYEEIKNLKKEFGSENVLDAATDILNNVDGVKAVLFLREEEPGKIRGSLRTKNESVDVSRLAALLGGGGHPKASAFRIPGHIEKTANGWKII